MFFNDIDAGTPAQRHLIALMAGLVTSIALTGTLQGATIFVPNGSFETPVTGYVDTRIDSWQKMPPISNTNGFLTGIFLNTAPTNADHIDNMEGNQAAYLFATPGVELCQDYASIDWAGMTHQFDAQFEPGKSYDLTVGVIGGGGGMSNGVTIQISLYYRDGASNKVVVAATTVTNSPTLFPTNTHFIDFSVHLPAVKSGDTWAGQYIGIQLLATASSSGYWDVDNVRLTAVREPVLINPAWVNGQFQCTLQSEPGLKFEILAAANVTLSISNWTNLGTLTNITGTIPFTDTAANLRQRFYQARQLP